MQIEKTDIPDVLIIKPKVFTDKRGFFLESYNKKTFAEAGIDIEFVQDNHSKSSKGVLRGLHFQVNHPQGKLVRALQGEVLDVAVDIRPDSPTLGKWVAVILNSEEMNQIWVPTGLAHGFRVLSDTAEIAYKTTDYYHPEDESGIRWNDPKLGIDWGNGGEPILSDKDQKLPFFNEVI
jgi:dTDP-4-dehydrorhamnose 3,5-epimerase